MKTLTAKSLANKSFEKKIKGKSGYIPDHIIELACHQGLIRTESTLWDSQIQPVSLDLRLGERAYRIQSSFLPENETVDAKLRDLLLYEIDIRDGGILEKGAIYLIPLAEELELPPTVYGCTNPKSSTGRLDMFTRVIIDRGHRFDEISPGYKGKLFLEVICRSFPVRVKEGITLNQLRLVQGDPDLSDSKFRAYFKKKPILYGKSGAPLKVDQVKIENGLYISVDLQGSGKNPIVAYKAKTNSSVIDLTRTNYYNPEDFWEPVHLQKKNRLILEPESFYIMMSQEKICIWPDLVGEMVAYEPNSGELRTHYAGFFDPGFGWHGGSQIKGQGTRAVMEVRPHDVPFMIEDGQTFCRLKFEKILSKPNRVYGRKISSHYHSQELALSKYFKS